MAAGAAKKSRPQPKSLSRDEARSYLVGQHGLRRVEYAAGAVGVRKLLRRLRCIQLDPLDPLGTNADLVALARIDGIKRGDIYRFVYPGHAFEHFAKERCLLPADAFPWYRQQAAETPWWRLSERLSRLPGELITAVLEEIRERGPLTPEALSDRGRVEPLSWNGWNGTSRATTMAIEVLWTRCEVVVCGRKGNSKLYDVPERALRAVVDKPAGDFARWALLERVEAAGLLSRAGGAMWSMLSTVRTSTLPDQLIEEGLLEEVVIEGVGRPYLAPAGFRRRRFPQSDGRIRIIAPLDPLLWDRLLIRQVFGFEYVWEVYKPAHLRRWGWYVCPLLQGDRFVGRIEGSVKDDALQVHHIWREADAVLDEAALDEALKRHALACGVEQVTRPRKTLVNP